ncbi:hypothetical protein LX36DRAFT_651843 [Colletotrichum falcatum]|nr:hypothetical protein LX36DRAFT_651843 [Colletotrichum falcatum]
MEVPPGVYESDSRVSEVIGNISTVLAIAFVAVALRIYTRCCIVKQIGMDDLSAAFTFLLVFGSGFAAVWNVTNGLGRHVYFLSPEEIKDYMMTFYTSIVLYNAALGGIKMTFLLQYYRVLAVQKMKKVFIGAMVIVGAYSVSQILLMIFQCSPIATFWDSTVPGTCLPNYPVWYANAAGNIFTDIMVLVLPLPSINSLKLRRGQKYVLLGIFCLGFFTCVISIIRIRFLRLEQDFTWTNVESSSWSVGELCCGLTCACLPTCRPLVSRFIPALSTRATKSSTYRSYGNHSRKTDNTSQQHDLELGGSADPIRRLAPAQNRNTEFANSKAEMYGREAYSTSQETWSSERGLPIQVPETHERPGINTKSIPLPVWRQEPVGNGGYRLGDNEVLDTRIKAKQGVLNDDDVVLISPESAENRGFI